MSQGTLLIVNGKAASQPALREAVTAQREQGWELAVRVTWEAGDAARYADEAADLGMDSVIAAGGDGTINEVVGALARRDVDADALPSLGLLPFGTANDFATALGIPKDIDAALALIREQRPHRVDIGCCESVDGSITRHFINFATGGLGAEVTTATSNDLKRMLGSAAYAITGIARFHALQPIALQMEGEAENGSALSWQGDSLAFGIGNGMQAGGGHRICPDARINNGFLDIAILPTPAEGRWLAALGDLLSGGLDAVDSATLRARVTRMRLRSERSIQINLDGEPVHGDDFRIEALPGRLRLHCPDGCPLLSDSDSAVA
ncbi:MAG: lipid kinase YegS [Lysobacteraceae bacterium]